jgi:hypothetical protein
LKRIERRARLSGRALTISAGLAALIAAPGLYARTAVPSDASAGAVSAVARRADTEDRSGLDSLFGRSGKLSFRLAKVGGGFRIPILARFFG